MKMPIRYNIVNHLIKNPDGMTPDALYENLKEVYPGERSCTPKEIDKQLMSLKGAGLAEIVDGEETEDEGLIITYRITEYGRELAKQYIGKFLS